MVLKVNTIDSRKIIGEVIKSPFFDLELYGIHPCGPRKSESVMLCEVVFGQYGSVIAGRVGLQLATQVDCQTRKASGYDFLRGGTFLIY